MEGAVAALFAEVLIRYDYKKPARVAGFFIHGAKRRRASAAVRAPEACRAGSGRKIRSTWSGSGTLKDAARRTSAAGDARNFVQ